MIEQRVYIVPVKPETFTAEMEVAMRKVARDEDEGFKLDGAASNDKGFLTFRMRREGEGR